jgi:hypothetical protein
MTSLAAALLMTSLFFLPCSSWLMVVPFFYRY